MSTATISYLALDADYDPIFDPTLAFTGTEAVAQDILTRLRLWYGEWWENLQLGLPVLQGILAQGASQQAQATMSLLIQTQIQQTPYVQKISNVSVQFEGGQFSFTCTVQTAFGLVTINNQLGGNAAIGGV